jgi:hypothetical protein
VPAIIDPIDKISISTYLVVHYANQCIQDFGAVSTPEDYYRVIQALID